MKKVLQNIGQGLLWSFSYYKYFLCANVPREPLAVLPNWTGLTYNYKFVGLKTILAPFMD